MFFAIGSPHNISELKEISPDPIASMRSRVKVVLIDDESFSYQDILHRHGYHVTKKDDIDDIESVEAYDIVLCDIKGIGMKLNPTLQGAHVISEIRKRYPFKYIVLYSGGTFDPSFNKYFQLADRIVKKDVDSEEWIEVLDAVTKEVLSPYNQWQKIKRELLAREVPLMDIVHIENNFVKSILSKDRDKFINAKPSVSLPPEIRKLLADFATQILIKLLLGGQT